MKHLPTILLLLSLPAGAVGFAVGVEIVNALPLPDGARAFLVFVAPLFVGGLFMVPFVIPFFDRKARRDLEAYRRRSDTAPDPADRSTKPRPRRK